MDLEAIAKAAVTAGFAAAGTLRTAGTITNRIVAEYNPTTGTPDPMLEESTPVPVNAILLEYTAEEIDGDKVTKRDREILIDVSELGGISLDENSYFTITADNTRFEIRKVTLDPSGNLYRLHGRQF